MNRRSFVKYLGATSIFIGATSCASINFFGNNYDEETSREAWKKLADKGEAFKYVNPNKKLPNILLYGDSISIGYTPTVRQGLVNKANVFRIYSNGQSSDRFIPKMKKLKETMFQPYLKGGWDFNWDVIHFNVGLHDLKYLKDGKLDIENGKQVSSIAVYKSNLDTICKYLQTEFPKAKLIFATTTAVPEEGADGRISGDSITYNTAALEVLANYPSIQINDLYAFTKPNAKDWHIKPHNVHYNTLGKKAQGKQVTKIITENL
ncbi:SGNH/GDSL hydrolase family protein [Algibacter sp. L1A34]|uniref:SGNH/GDSL hydrolase family protein n=1 Tax=Algibacter sp. L1A34 TaxID=2686365 RepID=UPI00131A7A78|nr:SGNH/GDSL hydrolase family protein [Algibacter sp. L1A34]